MQNRILIVENWSFARSAARKRMQFLMIITILLTTKIFKQNEVKAMTQFYIALPDAIQDLDGVTLSVEISDYKNLPVISWTYNGSLFTHIWREF